MSKFQSAKKHVALRENFFQIKYNVFQLVWAHAHMVFINKQLLDAANEGLLSLIQEFGNNDVYQARIEAARKRATMPH